MFLVGLTGNVGTGKSTVSQMLADLGIPIIDADKIARDVVVPNSTAWKTIRSNPLFGSRFFTADGELDRAAMAAEVFSNEKSRRVLERITHPEIRMEMIRQIVRYAISGYPFVILDVPLLFERSPLLRLCHKVVVVTCSQDKQFERLRKRNQWSEEEMRQRLAAQMPQEKKVRFADHVINNSHSLQETNKQVMKLHSALMKSKFHWVVRGVFLTGVILLCVALYLVLVIIRWIF
ncbi:dephospho-CoA kinase-like [Paramacrobiotus metropolitanus]|uniref:dephospho-CoA kinase-like n=1 Tax=Paramacrobiotus metropolitanus TaxID=2943436 RepID=UPI002445D950|nr:dephospho-CoA kinase-like [Paramacrobiotus metropolitanus]XP_055346263.1 dephospho-CoA kinase-like [Paramacrobiotus metropolitanus]